MGALVAFELAQELRRRDLASPTRLLVSGREAPHRPDPDPPIRHLPDAAFLAEVRRRYDAIPAEVLAEPELLDLLLPLIRADFTLTETYAYSAVAPLVCPISCFGGTEDDRVSREDLEAWADHTRGSVALRIFPGGHFFVESAREAVLQAVVHDLAEPTAQAVAL
jgi:surfactin synthase thioesterase subunit